MVDQEDIVRGYYSQQQQSLQVAVPVKLSDKLNL
jgi:hypothetical protein